jgi:hypothetical protein
LCSTGNDFADAPESGAGCQGEEAIDELVTVLGQEAARITPAVVATWTPPRSSASS